MERKLAHTLVNHKKGAYIRVSVRDIHTKLLSNVLYGHAAQLTSWRRASQLTYWRWKSSSVFQYQVAPCFDDPLPMPVHSCSHTCNRTSNSPRASNSGLTKNHYVQGKPASFTQIKARRSNYVNMSLCKLPTLQFQNLPARNVLAYIHLIRPDLHRCCHLRLAVSRSQMPPM